MNKKETLIGILVMFLLVSTAKDLFAQKKPVQLVRLVRKLASGTLVTPAPRQPVGRVKGIYLPKNLTNRQLEYKIELLSAQAKLNFTKNDIQHIAYDHELLRMFQSQIGPIFKGRPLPQKRGRNVVEKYFNDFEEARTKGTYEEAWAAFMEQQYPEQWHSHQKAYIDTGVGLDSSDRLARHIYDFHVQYFGAENLLRVRSISDPSLEAVLCAIPVNGFTLTSFVGEEEGHPLGEEYQFVIHYNIGQTQLSSYESALDTDFRVIK